MCGRYASSRAPEDLVEEFEVVTPRVAEPLAPDWNVAPTKEVYAVLERPARRDEGEQHPERQLRVLTWGLVPSWAKDPAIGNRMINARVETVAGEARLPQGVRGPSLPAPGRRLLRVVPDVGPDRRRQAAQAAVLHPSPRRRGAGHGRALRDLARPRPGGRRPAPLPLDLHRDHHRGRGRPGPHPRPDADDAGPGTVVGLARPGSLRATTSARCSCRPRRDGWRPTRSPRWSATCATTDPSWSSPSR